jgi:phosphatidate cytidylyltransferase
MKLEVFYIIPIYFALGAVSIFAINKKSSNAEEKSNRWLKYFVYAIIVNSIVCVLVFNKGFIYLASGIVILGLYEIITIWKSGFLALFFSVVIFSVLSFSFIQYAYIKDDDKQLLVYILVFTFDGFSQITGQLFGKIKFASNISPNKTIEGFLGGYITSTITAVIIGHWFGFSFVNAIIFSLLICTTAFIGDLTASYYKRYCNVKDYSNIIPGHGGILDRFDSFIFAGTTYWLMTL